MLYLRICFLCGYQIEKWQSYILIFHQTEGHQTNVQFNVLDISGWKNVCVCQHCENVWKFLRAARLPLHSPNLRGKGEGAKEIEFFRFDIWYSQPEISIWSLGIFIAGEVFLGMEINFNLKWESHTRKGDIFCWIKSSFAPLERKRQRRCYRAINLCDLSHIGFPDKQPPGGKTFIT